MAKIRVYEERGLVTFSGTLTQSDKFVLEQYTTKGFTVRESKPAKKTSGKEKALWLAAITKPADKKEFEKLCQSPKKGGVGFFGARRWAIDKGYSIDGDKGAESAE